MISLSEIEELTRRTSTGDLIWTRSTAVFIAEFPRLQVFVGSYGQVSLRIREHQGPYGERVRYYSGVFARPFNKKRKALLRLVKAIDDQMRGATSD